MSRFSRLLLVATFALLLGACGESSEGGSSADSTEESDATSTTQQDLSSETSAVAPDVEVATGTETTVSAADIGLGPILTGLKVALGAVSVESADDTTVIVTFDENPSSPVSSFRTCTVASGFIDDGMVIILKYPDSEETCE